MVAGTSPNAARKQARERVAALLDAADNERRRREAERRKRITDNAADIASNEVKIAELTTQIDELRADTNRRLAAIVDDNVSPEQAAAMIGRQASEVKAAVKAGAAAQAPKKRTAPAHKTAAT